MRRTLPNPAAPLLAAAMLLSGSCARSGPASQTPLTVAAASNLTGVIDEIAALFQRQTGIPVVLSYGSTVQLAQQIENGAPFDVFAAADTEHVDPLVEKGHLLRDTRAVYARGKLALWFPDGDRLGVREWNDLKRPEVRTIAVARPGLAPYGAAAIEAMKASGLWSAVEPKLVYATNINMARQYAATGNANAALTAYSLVLNSSGTIVPVDPALYTPIEQALAVVSASRRLAEARRFAAFLLGPAGKSILDRHGYLVPAAAPRR